MTQCTSWTRSNISEDMLGNWAFNGRDRVLKRAQLTVRYFKCRKACCPSRLKVFMKSTRIECIQQSLSCEGPGHSTDNSLVPLTRREASDHFTSGKRIKRWYEGFYYQTRLPKWASEMYLWHLFDSESVLSTSELMRLSRLQAACPVEIAEVDSLVSDYYSWFIIRNSL